MLNNSASHGWQSFFQTAFLLYAYRGKVSSGKLFWFCLSGKTESDNQKADKH
ncbi:hypothetical protein [Rodentibacter trehalosifermentans]|uniref:hypothetical protein n=1 Tax=Rodentibacter trehalosifermentans TaxID=1908263 RepID=UPI001F62078C|nr:hypothetical protein [Rodentibacter trehalosifermentans]